MENYELVPNMEILRAKTRIGSMKIVEDKKACYIEDIAKEMWRCAKIGKNETHYQIAIGDPITKKALEKALEEFKDKGYSVYYSEEGNLEVAITISWPLDL